MEYLKSIRKEKNISAEELADKCGISATMIWNYESGRRSPPLDVLCKLADALDVSLDMLVRGKEKKVDVSALKRKQNKLTDLYMNDLINREKYESEFRTLQSQIEEAELTRKPIDEHEVHSLLEAYNEWSPQARKTFWSYMVKSIVPNGKEFEITLIYT